MTSLRRTALVLALLGLGLPLTGPASADEVTGATANAGAYLAARQAMRAGDFDAASRYLLTAIARDPANPQLIESAIAAQVGRGEFGLAVPLAQAMVDAGWRSQLSSMVHIATLARDGDWATVIADLEAGRSVSPLADALTRGWALVGAGDMQGALAAFDAMIARPGMRPFGLYHKALALALAGDFEGADAIFSLPPGEGLQPSRRTIVAHAQILGQLGRADEATALIESRFTDLSDPVVADLHGRLAAGESLPWTFVRSPVGGLAEAYFSVAGAIVNETDDPTVLFHSRIALALDPAHVDAAFLTAQILERMEQSDLARAAYALVPVDDPAFVLAELGRADVLRRSGETAAAIEVLSALTRDHPELGMAHSRLADALRVAERLPEAVAAYDRALALGNPADPGRWRLLYAQAIAYFRLDDWPAAETGFLAALALAPDQASVLNFYGYSLVERGEQLEQALEMIERAVAADPENGAIVDSLGWALFRLGQHDAAVVHLERAAALEPADAVINDHLGDAYWMVGREREARFQWTRALSFDPEEADADRIRRKLDSGLDAVQAEEATLSGDVVGSGG